MNPVYALEPELLAPKPRRVQETNPSGVLNMAKFLRWFLIPFVLIGIGCLLWMASGVTIALAGTPTQVRVVDRFYSDSDEGGGSWNIRYIYSVGAKTVTHTDTEPGNVPLQPGQTLPARLSPFFPAFDAALTPEGVSVWSRIGIRILFAVFWNGVTGIFVMIGVFAPHLQHKLYRHGDIGQAVITDKKTREDEGTTYYSLEYAFDLPVFPGGATSGKGSVTLPQKEWEAISLGDRFTVLFDGSRPRRNVLYRFGRYRVVGE